MKEKYKQKMDYLKEENQRKLEELDAEYQIRYEENMLINQILLDRQNIIIRFFNGF